jgi:hypothetical protein
MGIRHEDENHQCGRCVIIFLPLDQGETRDRRR